MEEIKDFDTIFRQYYEALYYFAMQFLDETESQDVVSMAFEDVWLNFDNIQSDAIKSFLYKDVRNKCLDVLRHKRHAQSYVQYVQAMTSDYSEDGNPLEAEERERYVAKALAMLRPPSKEIFVACYVDGHSYKEVAEMMGISINTVKKHVSKALSLFRQMRKDSDKDLKIGK